MAAKEISVKKNVVRLRGEERERLETLIRKGKSPARRGLKARILLKADVSEAGKGWTDNRIIDALETSPSMVYRVRKQLVEEGLPPADHLLIERDRGQFVPSRRRRMMANVRAERLLKIPAEPSPGLRIPGAAAQTRVVSRAGIRLGPWESARTFKGIICDDISEFESHMPSHAVGARWRVYPVHGLCEQRCSL